MYIIDIITDKGKYYIPFRTKFFAKRYIRKMLKLRNCLTNFISISAVYLYYRDIYFGELYIDNKGKSTSESYNFVSGEYEK